MRPCNRICQATIMQRTRGIMKSLEELRARGVFHRNRLPPYLCWRHSPFVSRDGRGGNRCAMFLFGLGFGVGRGVSRVGSRLVYISFWRQANK